MSPALVPPVIPAGGLRRHEQPVLRVDELVVRPFETGDAPAVRAAYDDPAIRQWHALSLTAQEAVAWIPAQHARWAAETGAGWAVMDGATLVGRVGFRTIDLEQAAAEAAYWVVPAGRGRGVATRALDAVCDWMFEVAGFHRISLDHAVANRASCRVAEKSGFVLEGTARHFVLHADGWHDMHLHARLRPGLE